MTNFSKFLTVIIFGIIIGSLVAGIEKQYRFFTGKLDKVVQNSLKDASGDYSVVVKNLKTGESYSLKENKVFVAGSLYKLWVLGASFAELQKGKFKENDILSEDITVLNQKFGLFGDAELTSGTIVLIFKRAVNQMITISHNYAALLLTEKIGEENISNFLKKYGLLNSSLGEEGEPPKTTAIETALFFEKLYKGEIVNKTSSKKMIDLLVKQKIDDRIPKYLPKNVKVAHKTGELNSYKHDAGIVLTNNGDYILVVLSKTKNPQEAAETIAKLSEVVYKYFER